MGTVLGGWFFPGPGIDPDPGLGGWFLPSPGFNTDTGLGGWFFLQGVSEWTDISKLSVTGRNMQVRFCLKVQGVSEWTDISKLNDIGLQSKEKVAILSTKIMENQIENEGDLARTYLQ